MNHYIFQIAYDGTQYLGWQKTKEGPSIEGELEKALLQITQSDELTLQAASRTDRGVHALGQIVDCKWKSKSSLKSDEKLLISLNQLLPQDIRVIHLARAPDIEFHPTLSATHKTYQYRVSIGKTQSPLLRHYSWHVAHSGIDLEKLYHALPLFQGTKDFYAYCNQRKNLNYSSTVRTISEITCTHIHDPEFPELHFTLTGNNFLYKMVRNIVGTLIWIAVGKLSYEEASLAFQSRQRQYAGVTAPAHGLTLKQVYYPFPLFQKLPHVVKGIPHPKSSLCCQSTLGDESKLGYKKRDEA